MHHSGGPEQVGKRESSGMLKWQVDVLQIRTFTEAAGGESSGMRPAGVFLLMAGWIIVLSAVVLFSNELERGGFVLAGVCLEVLGLAFMFRGYSEREQEGT